MVYAQRLHKGSGWVCLLASTLVAGVDPRAGFGQVCGGAGTGDCHAEHVTPACADATCCNLICGLDDFCCDTEWDDICVDEADALCEGTTPCGMATAGDCFTAHAGGGCADATCCQAVCSGNTDCCVMEWTADCAQTANFTCEGGAGPCGGAAAGPCNVAHDTPGCNDEACCVAVCADDDFCCTDNWDGFCVTAAANLCNLPSPCGQEGTESCDLVHTTPGCSDVSCCDTVCAADTFCCTNQWDQQCVDGAAAVCTDPMGACCFPDFSCAADTEQQACANGGGAWMGEGSVCGAVDCTRIIYSTDDPFGGMLGINGFDVSTQQSVGLRFTASRRYNLDRVSVWFMNNDGDPDGTHPQVTISLRPDDPEDFSKPGDTIIESWTFNVSTVGFNPVLEMLDSVVHPTLAAETHYWLVAESNVNPILTGVWTWAGVGTGYMSTIDFTTSPQWQPGGTGAVAATLIEGTLNTESVGACCAGGTCTELFASECTSFACNVTTNTLPECGGACGTTCYGDADGNGVVTPGDRGFVAANIGLSAPALLCQYDMDGNGIINPGDRGFVAANIGSCSALPDFQNGSGLNGGSPDTRFGGQTFFSGIACEDVVCP